MLRKRISVKPKLDTTSAAKEKPAPIVTEPLPNQNPSEPSTTVSTKIATPAPKHDEAVQEAIQFLTSQKLEPIKSLNLQNKNVRMRELLFVNPPLTKEQKRHRKLNKPKQPQQSNSNNTTNSSQQSQSSSQASQSPSKDPTTNDDEIIDNNPELTTTNTANTSTNNSNTKNDNTSSPDEAGLVPQVKVGPDGKLILDESSTIITRKNSIQEQEAIVEDEDDIISKTDYNSYRQRNRTNKWSIEDTKRFYHGIAMFGTDFSMMEFLLFEGKRTRTELHKKFKREERMNKVKIDIALKNRISVTSEELDNLKEIL